MVFTASPTDSVGGRRRAAAGAPGRGHGGAGPGPGRRRHRLRTGHRADRRRARRRGPLAADLRLHDPRRGVRRPAARRSIRCSSRMTDRRIRHLPVLQRRPPGRHRLDRRPGEEQDRRDRGRGREPEGLHLRLGRLVDAPSVRAASAVVQHLDLLQGDEADVLQRRAGWRRRRAACPRRRRSRSPAAGWPTGRGCWRCAAAPRRRTPSDRAAPSRRPDRRRAPSARPTRRAPGAPSRRPSSV